MSGPNEAPDAFFLDNDAFPNPRDAVRLIEAQSDSSRVEVVNKVFGRLLKDAAQPRHASTRACINLCGFVQQCTKSTAQEIRKWAFSIETALKLFAFFLEWNEKDQHRSMRLILDLLTLLITQNLDSEVGHSIKLGVMGNLVSIIVRRSTKPLAKSAFGTLYHFLNKSVCNMEDVLETYKTIQGPTAPLSDLCLWRSFVSTMFSWMNIHYMCPMAGKCMALILRRLYTDMEYFTIKTWQGWLLEAVEANPWLLESIKLYVFGPLFKSDHIISLDLLASFNRLELVESTTGGLLDHSVLLQLAALEVGKRSGLVEDPAAEFLDDNYPSNAIVLRESVLESFLAHPSHDVRSTAFALVVSSPSTTKAFTATAFALLQRHLATYHSDFDAKFRYEMLGYSKYMIQRVKNVIAIILRTIARYESRLEATNSKMTALAKGKLSDQWADETRTRNTLRQHEEFFNWYLDFLKKELIPTASYQRHITALKAVVSVLKLGKHASGSDETVDADVADVIVSDPAWIRLILDLVVDPFDDVRETAAALLTMFSEVTVRAEVPLGNPSASFLQILQEFCQRASELVGQTARADHGNGAARSHGILCSWLSGYERQSSLVLSILDRLEMKISRAEEDLGRAVIDHPVHGDFAALNYVWDVLTSTKYAEDEIYTLHQIQGRVVENCKRIWAVVENVLCDDSPEGHLPQEMEDMEELDTKDLLSYSFRAINESSNLLRILVMPLRLSQTSGLLLPSIQTFKDIGFLAFDQLTKLRHRGALSTVTLTFTTTCQLTKSLVDVNPGVPDPEHLLQTWYQGTLSCIMSQASTTRRSAGIPALITGILAADARSPSFEEVSQELENIARRPARVSQTDGSNLPQVHALNCLKEIFKNSLLSKTARRSLPSCLQLATSSLESEVWAIRNCGLILLRSLIDCLFGTGESKETVEAGWDGHTIRLSYGKYPTLPRVLLSLLKSGQKVAMEGGTQSAAAEAVFPALDIIRRAGPPEEHRDELYGYISEYLSSPLWHVREVAARTLCSFLLRLDWVARVEKLIEGSRESANRLHGSLLTAKFVLERKSELAGNELIRDTEQLEDLLCGLRQRHSTLNVSPELRAALVEITNTISAIKLQKPQEGHGLVNHNQIGQLESSHNISENTNYRGQRGRVVASNESSAWLRKQLAVQIVYDTAEDSDVRALQDAVLQEVERDVETACSMLEVIPDIWKSRQTADVTRSLCGLHIDACIHSSASEPRTVALTNLAALLDDLLRTDDALDMLPTRASLRHLWQILMSSPINPSLSCAIVTASGPITAILALRESRQVGSTLPREIRAWGDMMRDSIDANNTFDTRMAATSALHSFTTAVRGKISSPSPQPHLLPVFLALYDALNDDDEEIRDRAAAAAAAMTGRLLVALEAADTFLSWLATIFAGVGEFRCEAAARMTGQTGTCATAAAALGREWIPAAVQLDTALRFDDSLFAVEEQNLFVDEVRETERWAAVWVADTPDVGEGETEDSILREWTVAGLQYLLGLAGRADDGPLGWSSNPPVFATCARVLLCAGGLVKVGGGTASSDEVGTLLERFVAKGSESRVHRSLLAMANAARSAGGAT